jgi:uncharacterized protein (DUF58 family)
MSATATPTLTPDLCHVCHHRAIAASARVRLPLRSRVWKGQAGEFAGAGTGSSLDFQDHRLYVPGDDPRHINWQAYARTGSYSMKLYREEVRPVVDLILDVSPSMFFDPQKAERVCDVFYLCVESARRSGASLHVHLLWGDVTRMVPYEAIVTHQWRDIIAQCTPNDPTMPPQVHRVSLRGNAIRILISDLLFPGEPEPIVRPLQQRQGSGILLVPYLPTEMDPDWSGNYEMVDAEKGSNHPHRIEPNTLKRYKEAYVQHFALWKQASQRQQVIMARVPSIVDLQKALHSEAIVFGALETY